MFQKLLFLLFKVRIVQNKRKKKKRRKEMRECHWWGVATFKGTPALSLKADYN